MLKIIVLYLNVKNKVRTEDANTGSSKLWIVRMQGECLSPSLFGIYINDIEHYFNKIDDAGITLKGKKMQMIWLSLQKVKMVCKRVFIHYIYCAKNKLSVNTSKSKLVCIFSKKKSIREIGELQCTTELHH